jgi:hypothetical protein
MPPSEPDATTTAAIPAMAILKRVMPSLDEKMDKPYG